uniref:DOC domain-containing protein n=1 Tax=Tetraselmis sp. GSL018 TaxID=582737 RepID=A0A061SCM0_9CHLO|mmetsp:Transcript_1219/g.2915  ORF Transcript_1219/g.2915 Transcript_1219/m.2915 type:complete len:102 (-) Transcript_1219:496-801(-)
MAADHSPHPLFPVHYFSEEPGEEGQLRESLQTMPKLGLREVGRLGVWSVTSAKPGNGVKMLRDGKTDTFWQSDGARWAQSCRPPAPSAPPAALPCPRSAHG